MKHAEEIFHGALLIAGTVIGVGMLGLPVATGAAGFVPAATIYLLCWGFMLCTGLLLLEVCTWMPKEANLITMVGRLFGPIGKVCCWIIYVSLFITVMIAHMLGGGQIVTAVFGGHEPGWISIGAYVVLFAPVTYLGAKSVGRFNVIFMSGVVIAYCLFVGITLPHVELPLLRRESWGNAWIALPILLTAFTFHAIIPTLLSYMKHNVQRVRLAIIWGITIPLVVYLVWELMILGIVPAEELVVATHLGETAIISLKARTGVPYLFMVGKIFAFFTLTTSYVALSLAYLDCLADGLKIKKEGMKKVSLCLAVFVPPLILALTRPDIFITALGYAGGFGCALLFGLLPPVMVWVGRYRKRYTPAPQLPGKKGLLVFLIIFILAEIVFEAMLKF